MIVKSKVHGTEIEIMDGEFDSNLHEAVGMKPVSVEEPKVIETVKPKSTRSRAK